MMAKYEILSVKSAETMVEVFDALCEAFPHLRFSTRIPGKGRDFVISVEIEDKAKFDTLYNATSSFGRGFLAGFNRERS